MKVGLVLCLLSTVLVPGLAGHSVFSLQTAQPTEVTSECAEVSTELCDICGAFADAALNVLLTILDKLKPFDHCGDICGILAQQTNDLAGKICDILCSIAGSDIFKTLIQKADLDPILFCKLLGVCATVDNGDANIIDASVNPKSGPQGEFVFTMSFKTLNGTGTGNAAMFINTVDGVPFSDSKLSCYSPGTYGVGWNLNTKPDPVCTHSPCEMWLPGTYNVTLAVCNGECESSYSHSVIYDEINLTFEITH